MIAAGHFDGHRLAREIDSDDPAIAMPYIRERRLVGGTDADYVLPHGNHHRGQARRSSSA